MKEHITFFNCIYNNKWRNRSTSE